MENDQLDLLLSGIREDRRQNFDELVRAKDIESSKVESASAIGTQLSDGVEALKTLMLEEFFERPRGKLLARFIGQKTFKVVYGNQQTSLDMGFTDRPPIRVLNVPYIQTVPLMTSELGIVNEFEEYKFKQGWVFRAQVDAPSKLKTRFSSRNSVRMRTYINSFDIPLGIHNAIIETTEGHRNYELRYMVRSGPRHISMSPVTVYSDGQRDEILSQADNVQLGVLGLINGAIEELSD
jgi:hypothetical protein